MTSSPMRERNLVDMPATDRPQYIVMSMPAEDTPQSLYERDVIRRDAGRWDALHDAAIIEDHPLIERAR